MRSIAHSHDRSSHVRLPGARYRTLVKQSRDERLITADERGRAINALTSIGVIGGCTDTNEINYLLVKAFRAGLGIIPIEQQSRI